MKSTDELLKILKHAQSAEQFIEDNFNDINDITFQEYLLKCIEAHSMTRSQVIDGADIQKNYGYQILNGSKKPSRDKVLALCFSMALSLEESNRLLILSDHSILYPRILRDSIIIFALEKKINLINTNILLEELEQLCIEP